MRKVIEDRDCNCKTRVSCGILTLEMNAVTNKKVFVALSGGVDSSVAALISRDQGYDVTGVFMRCYNLDGCAEKDAADARRVASHLGIPFYSWDFKKEYKKRVVEYMVEGYRRGETPNPDVMCNKEIKFGLFLEKALALGADYVATGHYTRRLPASHHRVSLRSSDGAHRYALGEKSASRSRAFSPPRVAEKQEAAAWSLFEAKDKNKDQSYFLWTLKPEQISRCLFPIGDYQKAEVREMARYAGLPTAEKKDSQGICFLGKVTLADFLKNYIPARRGAVLSTAGKKMGEHDGAEFYTIGERHVGVAVSKPVYVAEKDVKTNTLVMAEAGDAALYRKEVQLTDLNFTSPQHSNILKNVGISVLARVRYRQPLVPAKLVISNSQLENRPITNYRLLFSEPVKFVASGQSAVFYSAEERDLPAGRQVLGGGVIV
ncbi:MAG: tRNA-specific 2-thiouridylase MnmA [Candidatus Jorgensenbacteria bacterium GW2011_GWA1_48_13]|uniref:tRNA-specific 2-thiouridylase MnmA n=1 Tax=Candidatus Jorgensenbacteria bacterium GW2011_GWB1_50_10 TaxID=1618665 RepID=A0A0G1W7Z3_9BACT|nr:MAG: tRNA-specific 2-thiouridylase MnmA [Candidatus Jorgensenbacteria bacterium GW2011_GWA1_48_13]KKW14828.1 MAG: tRNA-specific 2-thiouridylase MnmA [Candidatus Jorgensenbacteria bacterium GW2011_GWB1_50_10]